METPLPSSRRRAVACLLASGLLLAVMDTLIKRLAVDFPVVQLMFVRCLGSLLVIGAVVLPSRGLTAFRTRRLSAHLLRALAGVGSMGCFFYAFKHLPLADVYVISFAAPLFLTALSAPLLGERVGARRWGAVLIGFCGVLVIAQPSLDAPPPLPLMVGLVGAAAYALAMIAVRSLAPTENSLSLVVYFLLVAGTVGGVAAIPVWVQPGLADLAIMLAIGVFGAGAQWLLTEAFRLAPAATLAPLEYAGLVWALLFGFAVFGDVPTLSVLAGGALIVASGLWVLGHNDEPLKEAIDPAVS